MSLRSVSSDISKCKLTGGACRNSSSRYIASCMYTPSRRRRVVTLYHIDGEENEAGITKQRKYSALVTDRERLMLRALVTTGLSHSSKGFSSHANVVDVALYDASLGESSGEMIAVIEFDRPIPRRALGPYFGSGTIPLPDDVEYLANRLYTRLALVPLYEK